MDVEEMRQRISKELGTLEKMINKNCDKEMINKQKRLLDDLLCKYLKDL